MIVTVMKERGGKNNNQVSQCWGWVNKKETLYVNVLMILIMLSLIILFPVDCFQR